MIRIFLGMLFCVSAVWVIDYFFGKFPTLLFIFFPIGLALYIELMMGFGVIAIQQGNIKNYKKELVVFEILLLLYIFLILEIIY